MTFTITAREFEALIPQLPAKDQGFANDLLAAMKRDRVSAKQLYWVEKLAQRAQGTETKPERATTAIGDLSGVQELFGRARKHLKSPAIVLAYHDERQYLNEVRLSIAGPTARVPGSINVLGEPGRTWYGRILESGVFEQSPRDETPKQVIELLKEFTAKPAEVATRHGKLTGKCCFCNTGLTDERSTAVGYGPTCAKRWGLPWGKAAASAAKAELEAAA